MSHVTLAVECEVDSAKGLATELEQVTKSKVISGTKNSLDGSPETILQIVEVATSLMAAVAPIVAAYIANRRVKKIKCSDIEIENPTQEQWEQLWEKCLSSDTTSAKEN